MNLMKGANKMNKDNAMNRIPYRRLLKSINDLFVVDIVLQKWSFTQLHPDSSGHLGSVCLVKTIFKGHAMGHSIQLQQTKKKKCARIITK